MKRIVNWIMIVMLLTLAAGCGGKATPAPTSEPAANTPKPANTVAPTNTPKPTNTPPATNTPKPPNTPEAPTPTPAPEIDLEEGWYHYTNGNYVRDIDVLEEALIAATGGGVVVWNTNSDEIIHYTTLEGLLTNDTDAVAVCATDAPKVYVGNAYGINVYNGEAGKWEAITPENSGMQMTGVDFLDCDEERGVLLVGYTFGLDIYDFVNNTWTFYDEEDGLISDWVNEAKYIGDDLWVVSSFGFSIVHPDGSVEGFDEDSANTPDEDIAAVAGDADGNVWLVGFDGILKYRDGEFTQYNSDNVEDFPFLDSFESVIVAEDGTVWTGNFFGSVCRFDPATETCLEVYEDEEGMVGGVNAMVMNDQGYIFYADDGEGISGFDGKTWKAFVLDELPKSNSYEAITQTPDGYIWVGGSTGMQIFSAFDAGSKWNTNDMDGYSVSSFYHAEDGWWIAHAAGASFYDNEKEEWTNYEYAEEPGKGIYDGGATAITVDGKGRVWFGTYSGLTVMDGEEFTYYDLLTDEERAEEDSPRSVRALLFDGTNVWVGAYGALIRFDENDEITIWNEELPGVLSLFSPSANALALDPEGNLLVGLGTQLYRYDAAKDTFNEVYEAESDVYYILPTQSGEIWLATYSTGIALYDGEEWTTFTTADGLSSNSFYGRQSILIDAAGTVWFAPSDGGLTRFVP